METIKLAEHEKGWSCSPWLALLERPTRDWTQAAWNDGPSASLGDQGSRLSVMKQTWVPLPRDQHPPSFLPTQSVKENSNVLGAY